MTKKEESVLYVDDCRGLLLAWLKETGGDPNDNPYITSNGFAYYNGYCQSKNTIELIKREKYEELLVNYKDLIDKYESLKESNEHLKTNYNALLLDYRKLKNKRKFFK